MRSGPSPSRPRRAPRPPPAPGADRRPMPLRRTAPTWNGRRTRSCGAPEPSPPRSSPVRSPKAKDLYALARAPYEAIEPIAESFGGLDPAIDARENDVAAGDRWTGFHRLEKAFWVDRSLDGMAPIARKLRADVQRLPSLDPGHGPRARADREQRDRAPERGLQLEDHGRGGPLLAHRPVGLPGERRRRRGCVRRVGADRAARDAALADADLGAVRRGRSRRSTRTGWTRGSCCTPSCPPRTPQTLAQAIDSLAEPLSRVAATVVRPG